MNLPKLNFKGWNLSAYAKGRRKLFVTIFGALVAFIVTNKPEIAGIAGIVTELVVAVFDYGFKEK